MKYTDSHPYTPLIQDEARLHRLVDTWDQLPAAQQEEWLQSAFKVVAANVRPPPDRLPLMVGDVLHNLRSSLDYLAWALVKEFSAKPPKARPGGTAFPIMKQRPDGRWSRPKLEPHTTDAIEALLDQLQPHDGPDEGQHPLVVLDSLANVDKHRFLHVVVGILDDFRIRFTFPNGDVTEERGRLLVWQHSRRNWFRQSLEENAQLGSLDVRSAIPALREQRGAVHVDCKLNVVVSLGEPKAHLERQISVTELLGGLEAYVRDEVFVRFAALSDETLAPPLARPRSHWFA